MFQIGKISIEEESILSMIANPKYTTIIIICITAIIIYKLINKQKEKEKINEIINELKEIKEEINKTKENDKAPNNGK